MRRIVSVLTMAALMAAMMVASATPALAFHDTLPPISEECGKGKCPGLGDNDGIYGESRDKMGDERNEACQKRGVCIGTFNN